MALPVRLLLPALFASSVATLGAAGTPLSPRRIPLVAPPRTALGSLAESDCPTGTIPDEDTCVHVPVDEDTTDAPIAPNAHRERSGRWAPYAQIPRRPDRSADYDAYRYPIPPGLPGGHAVVSGYDLDRPDAEQRRGRTLRAVGHGGVDLPQRRGTPVKLVALERQQGDADVVFVGPLFGTTVVTRHTVREGGQLRDYLVLHGHLEAAAQGLAPAAPIKDGDILGYVGDTGSPELVHLHLEARRVREGVDVLKRLARPGAIGAELLADEVSIVCDPRNVLPLK
jgi:murein DD-endopeptidase MepM/ murein hydrolase activator NlpD